MPITFRINKSAGYYIAHWAGKISSTEILSSYQSFYKSNEWVPGMNELADLSEADLTCVESERFVELATYTEQFYKDNAVNSVRAAVYCPNDLPYGLARIYQAWVDDSPEKISVFRKFHDAVSWLK